MTFPTISEFWDELYCDECGDDIGQYGECYIEDDGLYCADCHTHMNKDPVNGSSDRNADRNVSQSGC